MQKIDDVIASVKNLSISEKSAKSYESVSKELVDYVNKSLSALPNINELIGGNPLSIMENNHKNHSIFMSTVFNLKSFELLAKTIPWVYRVYKSRGFSYDYFPVELTAWQSAVKKFIPKEQAIEILSVYDWMKSQHSNMIELSISCQGLDFSPSIEFGPIQEILLSMLLKGDSNGCLKLIANSVNTKEDLKDFYLNVVTPVMYKIGILWEKNEISVAEEHLSTAIIGRLTAMLYGKFAIINIIRGKAIVSAVVNELHEVGARMVSDFLEMEGWDVTYIGSNTPINDLMILIKKEKPFIVCLSATTLFNLDRVKEAIENIKKDNEANYVKIMVGGLAFNNFPDLWKKFGADCYSENAKQSAILANNLWDSINK